MDWLKGLTDVTRARADTSDTLNSTETDRMSHGEGAETYLRPGDAKCLMNETDGTGIHADRSTGQVDAPSIKTDTDTPENEAETISKPQKKDKPPDSPSQSARTPPDEPDGCGNHPNMLSMHTDAYSIEAETETAENGRGDIRTGQIDLRR